MEWLNYHHLLYFWAVVREGGVVPAARALRLTHPTVSGQIKQLEQALGEQLLERRGRKLELTEVGRLAYGYADEIFGLGRELMDVLRGRHTGRPVRLLVGVTNAIPKLVVRQLLDPALHLEQPVQLTVEEDRYDRLLAELALHHLDVVLADAPLPPGVHVRAYNHLLGQCGISLCAAPALARSLGRGFPGNLERAPMLLPHEGSALRRGLDQWLSRHELRPRVVAEMEDTALIEVFGRDGLGVFAVPQVIEGEVLRSYGVKLLGRAEGVTESFYAVSIERRIRNPAVGAITESARHDLFG